jgi:hypothetical protein
MNNEVAYTEKDGTWYAISQSKVIAHSADLAALEQKVAMDPMGDGGTDMPPAPDSLGLGAVSCPQCQSPADAEDSFCRHCGSPIQGEGGSFANEPPAPDGGTLGDIDGSAPVSPYESSVITTPNGLKGTVLGKVAGLWSDELTVRLENGRIVRVPFTRDVKVASAESSTPTSPIARLEARLAASVDGTRPSLVARRDELAAIKKSAAAIIANGVSDAHAQELDSIVVTADAEMAQVDDAIAHHDAETTQAYAPPAPFSMGVADEAAASLGGRDGSWLDGVTNDLIAEAEATNYKQLMDEGPEAFTAELADSAIADAGVTRSMASSFIRSKTAGTDPRVRDPYETTWLERVEQCRRAELTTRKQTTHKEAAAQEDQYKDAPDESLFI